MGVVLRPHWRGFNYVGSDKFLCNLKPAKYDMQVGCIRHISPLSRTAFSLAKPSEEQKQVPGTDAHIVQMGLSHRSLSKTGSPTAETRQVFFAQIRVKVHPIIATKAASSQIKYNIGKIVIATLDVGKTAG